VLKYEYGYYHPTHHLIKRYRQRMRKHVESKYLKKVLKSSNVQELARRINYMLLFSIHGRPGDKPDTEVRYYFGWNIVINNKTKEVITLYHHDRRKIPPVFMFGHRKLRNLIYDIMFRPNSKVTQALLA